MAPTVVLGLSDLRSQARTCTPSSSWRPTTAEPPAHPRPLVRLVLLGAVGALALCAAVPGIGGIGLGGTPAQAAPSLDELVEVPPTTALPQTGGGPGATGTASDAQPRGARTSSSCTAPCSTSQVISVTIEPGPFEVSFAPATVSVVADADGTGRTLLTGVRVTDLRGVGAGWTLATRVTGVVDARTGAAVPGATVEVAPVCRRTAGPLTLESADPSVVGIGGTATLCIVPIASQGSLAGGLVSVDADLVVRGAPASTRVVVGLATSLT